MNRIYDGRETHQVRIALCTFGQVFRHRTQALAADGKSQSKRKGQHRHGGEGRQPQGKRSDHRCIDPEAEELPVEIPIKDRKSFNPAEVANAVPQIRALLLLRKLLLEMQAQVDNRKDVRNLVQQIFGDKEELAQLRKELEPYAGYRLPARKELAAVSAPVT